MVTAYVKVEPPTPTKAIADGQANRDRPEIPRRRIFWRRCSRRRRRGCFDQPARPRCVVANRNEGTVSVFTISGNT